MALKTIDADGHILEPATLWQDYIDPGFREKVTQDPEFKQYIDEHGGWDGIVAAVLHKPSLKQYEGKRATEIARMRGQESDPAQAVFDVLLAEGNFPQGVFHNMA